MKPWRRLAFVSVLTLAAASPAAGHAIVVGSTPAADAVVAAPGELVLRFSSRIEKRLSSVRLVGGPRGARIPLGSARVDTAPDVLRYALPPLAPGAYRVEWKVLSVDGHSTEGVVRFTVAPETRRLMRSSEIP